MCMFHLLNRLLSAVVIAIAWDAQAVLFGQDFSIGLLFGSFFAGMSASVVRLSSPNAC